MERMAAWRINVSTLVDSLLTGISCPTKTGTRIVLRCYGTRQESKQWKQKPNRAPRLSIILKQDVHKLGVTGQIVKVKHGYGRNHLIPQRMAVYATHYNVKELKAFEVEESASRVNEVDLLVDYLTNRKLTVRKLPDDTAPIFEQDISKAFRQNLQLHIPLDCIELLEPITDFKTESSVQVRLDETTLVTVPVMVDLSLTKNQQRKRERKTFSQKDDDKGS